MVGAVSFFVIGWAGMKVRTFLKLILTGILACSACGAEERVWQLNTAAMPIDYPTYGEGEALLGWLNASLRLSAPDFVDGNAVVRQLAAEIQGAMREQVAEIAHLKMTLAVSDDSNELAILNLIRNDAEPEMAQSLIQDLETAELTVNFRAEAAPELLLEILEKGLEACRKANPGLAMEMEHVERFRPGMPTPVHRMESPL